jgi:hypothetical protein
VDLLPDAASSRALLSLVLLVIGTALALLSLRDRRWDVSAAALATAGVVGWTLTSSAYAGPVLLVVLDGNGLHLGDLLSVPAALLVLWLCYRSARR